MATLLLYRSTEAKISTRARRYAARLRRIVSEVGSREAEHILGALAILRQAQREVNATILRVPVETLDAFHARQIKAEISRLMTVYDTRLQRHIAGGLHAMVDLAPEHAESVLTVLGRKAPATSLARLSPQLVEVAQQFTADLITDVSQQTIRQISTQLDLAVLAGERPEDAMRRVGHNLRGPSVFRTIATRAEVITRTEMGRIYSLAEQASLEGALVHVPDLKKTWLSALHPGRTRDAHAAAHGQVVPVNEPFIVGGERLMYPRDPHGSAAMTVNCLCVSAPMVEDMEAEWREMTKEQRSDAA